MQITNLLSFFLNSKWTLAFSVQVWVSTIFLFDNFFEKRNRIKKSCTYKFKIIWVQYIRILWFYEFLWFYQREIQRNFMKQIEPKSNWTVTKIDEVFLSLVNTWSAESVDLSIFIIWDNRDDEVIGLEQLNRNARTNHHTTVYRWWNTFL